MTFLDHHPSTMSHRSRLSNCPPRFDDFGPWSLITLRSSSFSCCSCASIKAGYYSLFSARFETYMIGWQLCTLPWSPRLNLLALRFRLLLLPLKRFRYVYVNTESYLHLIGIVNTKTFYHRGLLKSAQFANMITLLRHDGYLNLERVKSFESESWRRAKPRTLPRVSPLSTSALSRLSLLVMWYMYYFELIQFVLPFPYLYYSIYSFVIHCSICYHHDYLCCPAAICFLCLLPLCWPWPPLQTETLCRLASSWPSMQMSVDFSLAISLPMIKMRNKTLL